MKETSKKLKYEYTIGIETTIRQTDEIVIYTDRPIDIDELGDIAETKTREYSSYGEASDIIYDLKDYLEREGVDYESHFVEGDPDVDDMWVEDLFEREIEEHEGNK